MNYIKLFEDFNNKEIFFHHTNKSNVDSILKNGLKINYTNDTGKTYQSSIEYVKTIYNGIMPIFLTTNKNMFMEDGDISLKVDITGLKISTDIPTFEDYLDSIWGTWKKQRNCWKFDEELIPEELYEVCDENGKITFKKILNDPDIILKISDIIQTIAVLENINPDRISLI